MGRRNLNFGVFQPIAGRARDQRLLSWIYHSWRLRRLRSTRNKPIIVFQMGKVGSTAVAAAVATSSNCPVYHVHYLTDRGIDDARYRLSLQRHTSNRNVNRWCLFESAFLKRNWNEIIDRHDSPKFISIVRDPIARNLSSFFYSIDDFLPNAVTRYADGELTIQDIADAYLNDFGEHDFPEQWLRSELQAFTRIDILQSPFDAERGYGTYTSDRCELLILKLENIDVTLESALREFLGISAVNTSVSNAAAELPYFDLYNDFKAKLPLPDKYVENAYASPLIRHFYSEIEIDALKDKWRSRLTPDIPVGRQAGSKSSGN